MNIYCPHCEAACSPAASACPKCGHPFQAHAEVEARPSVQTCPTCRQRVAGNAAACPACGQRFDDQLVAPLRPPIAELQQAVQVAPRTQAVAVGPLQRYASANNPTLLIVLSFLVPLAGIIIGAIFMTSERQHETGVSCLLAALAGIAFGVVGAFILWVLFPLLIWSAL